MQKRSSAMIMKQRSKMSDKIIKIYDNAWAVDNGNVRFFLLEGSEKAMLIDSGQTTENVREIVEDLTKLPIMLVNTHSDPDHIHCNSQFKKCYMHADEIETYEAACERTGLKKIPVETLEDGEVIDLGGRPIEVIAIPGHTKGSIALLDINARALFTGDSVQDSTIYMQGDHRIPDEFPASLMKLEAEDERFDILYPSHGSLSIAPDMIGEVFDAMLAIRDGEVEGEETDLHGRQVLKFDCGVCGFFMDFKK